MNYGRINKRQTRQKKQLRCGIYIFALWCYRRGWKHRRPVLPLAPTHNFTLRNVPKILRPVSESFRREQPIAVEFDERVLHRNKKSCIFKKIPPPPNFFVSYSPELVFFVQMGTYDAKVPIVSSVMGLGCLDAIWLFAVVRKICHHTQQIK